MILESEQIDLLSMLVEAERSIPREARQEFIISETIGPPGVDLVHPAWPRNRPRVFKGDIEILANAGLISWTQVGIGGIGFYVTPYGFQFYAEHMRQKDTPTKHIEKQTIEYLKSQLFQRDFPQAYKKWSEAENILWGKEADASATTIGHLIRESMQEFVSELIAKTNTPNVNSDKAKTVSRLQAVLAHKCGDLGKTESEFLKALIAYWGTVSDLAQRQEHGAQREKSSLTWIDSRRVVFQSAMVMFEIAESFYKN